MMQHLGGHSMMEMGTHFLGGNQKLMLKSMIILNPFPL